MTPGDPSDPKVEAHREAASERAKAAARESAHWLRDEAARLYTGYRQQSKYFKWRSWIVLVYGLIALSSVVVATEPTWSNPIRAYVVPGTDPDGRLLVHVQNLSPEEWTNVDLVLDGRYHFRRASLPRNESLDISVIEFVRSVKGLREKAKSSFRPRSLEVRTDQGSYRHSLSYSVTGS